MSFNRSTWDQLKSITADDLVKALERDGWAKDKASRASTLAYIKKNASDGTNNRIVIHYHPQKTYGAKLLQMLIADIGWTESDLKRLKLIK